ncbi:MAG: DUF1330 domain-containing protein [Henriciella sp.]|nr:DUF1330 domain-containing protein [Henriciella sp.]
MSAYMIVFAKIHDRERFINEYAMPTAKLIGEFGGEYLVRGPGVESLEGGLFDGTSAVISKWPSKDAIKTFWNSEAYAKLKAARQDWAEAHVMIVEG